ncbi:LIC11113 family protein [Leptospira kmetyi]|uniref:LIC11113 family protein n=1 Tax=Leptospira kmetyi TaxID=408139 RepID=UPI001083451D|nr:hypothetical protein [Leptospira kmetyi]TGK13550.1 hypothetical protein EHO62_17590 [Leptospira kmetyi]TGK31264.1 hypothetical protein EHO66_09075 [Leptospira kmetyi]
MRRELRKDCTLSRFFPDVPWTIRFVCAFVLALSFFSIGNLRAENESSDSFSEHFHSFLKEFQKHPSSSLARSFRSRYSSFEPPKSCGFEETGRFEKVVYLSYHCKDQKWPGFIYLGTGTEFWKNSSVRISFGEVLEIGKKVFLEVKPSYGEWYREDSSLDFKKQGKKDKDPIRPQPPKEYKDNFGLRYFLSIAKHPAKRDLKSGKEIFFDSNCPLIFLKKDSDFYWEKAVYYSFQASCVPSSPYSFIRIRSDFLGKIRLDDKDSDQIQEGAKYLGKLKIHSIEADKILWEQEAEIYNE